VIDRDLIETPENVELERRLSGIGSRFIAGVVDTLILVGALLVLLAMLLVVGYAGLINESVLEEYVGMWLVAVVVAVAFLIYWGYFAFFEMYFNGQTPGKRAVKIRVVRADGAPISFIPVAIRNLLRAVDGIGLYGVAGIAMFATKRIQRLGDLAAGTVVISEQVPEYSRDTDKRSKFGVEPEVSPDRLRATRLTPREYHLLRNYWLRRHLLQFDARARLAPKLIQPILERMGQSIRVMNLEACEAFIFNVLGRTARPEAGEPPQPADGPTPAEAHATEQDNESGTIS